VKVERPDFDRFYFSFNKNY